MEGKWITESDLEELHGILQFCHIGEMGGLQKRNEFCDFQKVQFEGRESYVPGNYDTYLRDYYGDYMQIPPKEKRELGVYLTYNPGKYGKRGAQYD